jgi:hypothetical protein
VQGLGKLEESRRVRITRRRDHRNTERVGSKRMVRPRRKLGIPAVDPLHQVSMRGNRLPASRPRQRRRGQLVVMPKGFH